MAEWTDEYEQMLQDCIKRDAKLTDWERDFVESLDHRLAKGKTPTPKQCAVLDRIWDRVTA